MRDTDEEYINSIPVNMYNIQDDAERVVGMYEGTKAAIEELRYVQIKTYSLISP